MTRRQKRQIGETCYSAGVFLLVLIILWLMGCVAWLVFQTSSLAGVMVAVALVSGGLICGGKIFSEENRYD